MTLALMLREGTKTSHRAAESTPFIQAFFAAKVSADAYRELLIRLYQVYTALEHSFAEHQHHPVLGRLHSAALARTTALESDLQFYYGDDWQHHIQPTPATKTYVERIRTLAREWPLGLVAHHYTRYLGDLSGGQVLKRIATKAFQLMDGRGVAFYEFPAIPNHDEFKAKYRATLDELALESETAQKIVDEANHAFHLNTQLFTELQAN